MRWTVVLLAVGLVACGRDGATGDPNLSTEAAEAQNNSASPLVFSLIDDTTGDVVDDDMGDGGAITIDPTHAFTLEGDVKSGHHVGKQVKLRLTDPDGNPTAITDDTAPYTIDTKLASGNYKLRAQANGNNYNISFTIADTSTTNPPPPPPPTNPPPGGLVQFPAGLTYYWQLSGTINTSRDVDVYDIDLEDNEHSGIIGELKSQGRKVICYISAGDWEDWRSDASQFPASVIGNPLDGWPGEYYLDIRAAATRTVIASRINRAVAAGCDAIEPDVLDGFQNDSGFPLTLSDEWDYLHWLVSTAHGAGIAMGLKNMVDLIDQGQLAQLFDWALDEQCYDYDECDSLAEFVAADKAVFVAEYKASATSHCAAAKADDYDLVIYNLDLDGKTYTPCP